MKSALLFCLAGLIGALTTGPAAALECQNIRFEDTPFSLCEADMSTDKIQLFLRDENGETLGQFSRVRQVLQAQDQTLGFAMNAGMYHEDRSPVGHYVENHKTEMRVIPNAGPGNFGLLPNGVFCIRDGRADVFETLDFIKQEAACEFATQSGPMLVIDGALHPRFLVDSTSRYVRNGVGTSVDGQRVVFAISNRPVTFHKFGRFFRDVLKVPQALYFDGRISRIYAPQLNRDDPGFTLGPIVGVVSAK